jgi:hypothetical protein
MGAKPLDAPRATRRRSPVPRRIDVAHDNFESDSATELPWPAERPANDYDHARRVYLSASVYAASSRSRTRATLGMEATTFNSAAPRAFLLHGPLRPLANMRANGVARRDVLAASPPGDNERRPVAG